MKNKRKLIHRIGAFLCALVVVVSAFGVNGAYYADDSVSRDDILSEYSLTLPSTITSDYKIFIFKSDSGGYSCVALKDSDLATIYMYWYNGSSGKGSDFMLDDYGEIVEHIMLYEISSSGKWSLYREYENKAYSSYKAFQIPGIIEMESYDYSDENFSLITNSIIYSDFDVCIPEDDDFVIKYHWPSFIYVGSGSASNGNYNSTLGYLQNVSFDMLYLRGDYTYYYNDESLKYVWSFDTISTSGLDLKSGNYSVRHYIEPWVVNGYEDEDCIRKGDMYLMGTYDSSSGSFEYLDSDYDDMLEGFGWTGCAWYEIFYFELYHHYLQIVNEDTGEVGGYVHIWPYDETGEFGTEHIAQTLDENFEIDDSGYDRVVVDNDTGAGSSYEEAVENASTEDERPHFGDIENIKEVSAVIEYYGSQVTSVASGIGAFIGLFPPWIVACLSISLVLIVVIAVVKIVRG